MNLHWSSWRSGILCWLEAFYNRFLYIYIYIYIYKNSRLDLLGLASHVVWPEATRLVASLREEQTESISRCVLDDGWTSTERSSICTQETKHRNSCLVRQFLLIPEYMFRIEEASFEEVQSTLSFAKFQRWLAFLKKGSRSSRRYASS